MYFAAIGSYLNELLEGEKLRRDLNESISSFLDV